MQQNCQICGKPYEFNENSTLSVEGTNYSLCADCRNHLYNVGNGRMSQSRPYEDGVKYFNELGAQAKLDDNLKRYIFLTKENILQEEQNQYSQQVAQMLVELEKRLVVQTTTPTVSGYEIVSYLKPICTDPYNYLPAEYQLAQKAVEMGANAIVGITYDYIPASGTPSGFIYRAMSGTAVIIKKING